MRTNNDLSRLLTRLAATECEDSRKLDADRAAAAAALGSIGGTAAVPELIRALSHPNQVCVAAALALGRIAHVDAVQPLIAVLADRDKFWMARGAAAVALGEMGAIAEPALPALEQALELDCQTSSTSWDERAREAVADAISHTRDRVTECALKGNGQRYAMWGFR